MMLKDRLFRLILFVLFSAVVIYTSSFILFSEFREIIFLIPDDSSYYLKIAKNFSEGKGFTFDGINPTNGFQPLWQYFLALLMCVLKTNPETTMRIVLIIQIFLLVLSGFLFYKILSGIFEKRIILASGITFIVFVFIQSINGMETALLIFMLLLLFYFAMKFKVFTSHNIKNEFIFGLIFGFVILTRLDAIFLLIPVGFVCIFIFFSYPDKKKENILRPISIISGTFVIILPYLLYNLISFGSIIPISGYLKSSFPLITFEEKFTSMLHYREMFFAFLALVYFVWFLFNIKKIKVSESFRFFLISMAVMSSGIILLFIYIVFFMNWIVFSWYFITYSLFVSLAICIPFKYILSFKKFNAGEISFWVITLFILFYWGYKIYVYYEKNYELLGNNWNIESYDAALWVKENTNKQDMFAMKDTGHFSFFGKRNVISLDGLVNNFEYQEVIKNKNLNWYFKRNNVKYLVQHAIWNRSDITYGNYDTVQINYVSHKYSLESDPIIVSKKDEIYRSAPYYDGDYNVAFIIWKLKQ